MTSQQVIYAPAKAFKKIIENPKYLGALLVLILFVGLAMGFEFVQFSKIYTENTDASGWLSNRISLTQRRGSSSNVRFKRQFR